MLLFRAAAIAVLAIVKRTDRTEAGKSAGAVPKRETSRLVETNRRLIGDQAERKRDDPKESPRLQYSEAAIQRVAEYGPDR